ncbi:MAG: hypothetical protein EZS28_003428 [Streblomastix strix]|uniref:Uncharacterized protein n=1 Tax=Streblomastix strix TaxID=222440 RepID=A0A5J4X3I7_9EUKA|nr:MAG: hypothetical protein EZS28_003428 [Streblomastix strix]
MGQAIENKFVFTTQIPIQLLSVISHADSEVLINPKTRKLFEKLKKIAQKFEEIDDIEDLAIKVSKYKRTDEVSITDSGSERSTSDRITQHYCWKLKRRRKDQSSDFDHSIESLPQQKLSKQKQGKYKKTNNKFKHYLARQCQHSSSENSQSDSSTASSSYASTDDDIVHNELRKIINDSVTHYKPLDYKYSVSRIEEDIRAVAPDKIDFSTVNPLQKLEGHGDEDAAESVILSTTTTRSVPLMANVAAKSPEKWQKQKKPIMRTFRLSQQTTTHAYAALESLVLNEKCKYLKAATPLP